MAFTLSADVSRAVIDAQISRFKAELSNTSATINISENSTFHKPSWYCSVSSGIFCTILIDYFICTILADHQLSIIEVLFRLIKLLELRLRRRALDNQGFNLDVIYTSAAANIALI